MKIKILESDLNNILRLLKDSNGDIKKELARKNLIVKRRRKKKIKRCVFYISDSSSDEDYTYSKSESSSVE